MTVHARQFTPSVEIVHHAPPGRLNEDAWLVAQAGPLEDRLLIAAIDGATTRLTPPPLQRYLDARPVKLTPAAFAARTLRDALARHIAEGMFADLRTLLVEANSDLGRALIRLLGALTLEAMQFPEDVYRPLAHDPRLVRLGLPACVVTLVEIDALAGHLRYAHAGDTSLLVAGRDGSVRVPTNPDLTGADDTLRRAALKLRASHPGMPLRELLQLPEIRAENLNNALRHNYVDSYGLPQPSQGVGVVDGLPELRYFVQTGELLLDGVAFICAMTDGLEWPAGAGEVFADDPAAAAAEMRERRAFMAAQIGARGLASYLARLRAAEAEDPDHERYPRMKTHDDATGILVRFGDGE